MKSVPPNAKSGDVDLREAARAAARRDGMTLGEWLDDAIAERAAHLRIAPESLDESNQVEAIAARLRALPLDDTPRRTARPLPRRIELEPNVRGRKPNVRLIDAAAVRLGLAPQSGDEVSEVARRIAELDEALGRRDARPSPILAPTIENRLRRIAESLLDPAETQSPELRRIEARLDRLMDTLDRAPKSEKPRHDPLQAEIAALRSQIDDLSRAIVVIGDRATKQTAEPALLDLLSRIEASRHDGVSEDALAPIMSVLLDIRTSLENSPTTTARAMRVEIDTLHRRLDALAESGDGVALRKLRDQVETMARGLADLVPRLAGQEALHRQIAALAERVEDLAVAPRELADRVVGVIDDLRASIERIDTSPGFRTLQTQIEDMAWQCGEAPAAIMESLQDLRASLEHLADRPTLRDLQGQVADLAFVAGEAPRRVIERLDDLHRAFEAMAEHPAFSADLRAAPLPTHVIESLAEIRLSLARLAANAGVRLVDEQAQRLQSIEERVAEISDKLEAPPIIERIAGLQEAVLARIDRLRSELPHDQLGALRARLEEVHRAVTQPMLPQAPAHGLEDIVDQLAARLERTSGQDPRALQAIENQVLRIAERLDRQGETSEAVSTLERSIADLVAQISDTRPAADAELGEAIARDLSSLRHVQDETERRTRATLDAVHETLERVVDRLAMLEGDLTLHREAPVVVERSDAPVVAAPPSRQDVALQLAEPRAAQKSFIAAARRATQLMGGAPQPPRVEHGPDESEIRPLKDAPATGGKLSFGETSRKIVLGVAGLVLALGAYQLMRDESPMTSAITEQTAPQVADAAAPTPTDAPQAAPETAQTQSQAAEPAPASAQQADAPPATDPTPVGSVPRPATALALLRDMANAGNPAAQFELGSRLIEGRGVPRDPAAGARMLEKAAQSYAPAQYRLGALYEKGVGVERAPKEAAAWYGRAAAAGHVRAMHNLGVLLAEGLDGRPDYAGAAANFRRAAEHGLRDSQYNLAVLLGRGLGVDINLVEAYKFFELAGAQGDADALIRRDEIASRMLPKQLSDARKAIESFASRAVDPAANEPPAMDAIISGRANVTSNDAPAISPNKGDARVTSLK